MVGLDKQPQLSHRYYGRIIMELEVLLQEACERIVPISERRRAQIRQAARRWRVKHLEKARANVLASRAKSADYYKEYQRRWLEANRGKLLEQHLAWKRRNPSKNAASRRRYIAKKVQAVPAWASLETVQVFYDFAHELSAATGVFYQVDHIVPLSSTIVCGLHCEDNLRVIPAELNRQKSNKLLEI